MWDNSKDYIKIDLVCTMLQRSVRQLFGTVREEYSKTFLSRITFKDNAYYTTFKLKETFKAELENLHKNGLAYVIAGDNFPMTTATIVFNCDNEDVAKDFLEKNAYTKAGVVKDYVICEFDRIGSHKLSHLGNFYESK